MPMTSVRLNVWVEKPLGYGLRMWLARLLLTLGTRLASMDLLVHVEAVQ